MLCSSQIVEENKQELLSAAGQISRVSAWVSSCEMTWSYGEGGVALTCLSGHNAVSYLLMACAEVVLPLWPLFVLEVAVHV